jgi:hypothetical protein
MKATYRVTSCNSVHCRVTVFINGQNAGQLVLTPTEWILFSTAQLLAVDKMTTGGYKHYNVLLEDQVYNDFISTQPQ